MIDFRTPLFPFIEMDYVIIDTLHLFLRISDILLDNFIRDLKAKDALEKISFKSGRNVEKFTSYINSRGIPFKLTINLIQNIAVQRNDWLRAVNHRQKL